MTRKIILYTIFVVALLGGCNRSLSPEEQIQVQALQTELETTKKEVTAAELKNAQINGGLLKVLTLVRLEILKTNVALIQQRIHAIESGAKVTIETLATKPDPKRAMQLEEEVTKQEAKLSDVEAKAKQYSGGLVGAMAVMGVATETNSLAMLRQQYLIAKYGLASLPQIPPSEVSPALEAEPVADTGEELREQILDVKLVKKQSQKQNYQDYVFFDVEFSANGLDKPARAIKGILRFNDLFGEQMFALKWTIEKPIGPGATYIEKGSGFEYNQFIDAHKWVRSTAIENMKVKFRVDNILYEDGTSQSFD
jgi:hypothetical protein